MIEDGLRGLARIHAVDWKAAGFDWLVAPGRPPGVATQLALWTGKRFKRGFDF